MTTEGEKIAYLTPGSISKIYVNNYCNKDPSQVQNDKKFDFIIALLGSIFHDDRNKDSSQLQEDKF